MARKRILKHPKSSRRNTAWKVPDCRNFTGYKPCFPGTTCYKKCVAPNPRGERILIINLDAMGAVLQTTALLPALKRKYPRSHISWITLKNAVRLLDNNPYLDATYVWDPETLLILQSMTFDTVLSIDKTRRSCAFAGTVRSRRKLGFGLDANGVILPLNKDAEYLYLLGLDDRLKFRGNEKPGTQIVQEAMGLTFKRDEYVLELSQEERDFCGKYRASIGLRPEEVAVGFNTGCSLLYPNKKMTIEQHVALIERLADRTNVRLLLLGGPEDTERNAEIVRRTGDRVISTPTTEGVRRGICYENVCDVVITGDSFGMHVAIALKKYVIAWFGLSCWTEIDLYDRGVKLIPEGLACAPCWRKECPFNLECISMIDLDRIVREVDAFVSRRRHR